MSKRVADGSEAHDGPLKAGGRPAAAASNNSTAMDMEVDEDDKAMGEFADEFEDEYESEDDILEAGVDGRPDAEREADEAIAMEVDGGNTGNDVNSRNKNKNPNGTFIVGRNKLEPGQHLAPDLASYELLHNLSTPWPCLSFDIVRDGLGDGRDRVYPATMYTIAGTQADSGRARENQLMAIKFSGLSRMESQGDGDSDQDDDDDDDEDHGEDAEPILESRSIPLDSTTNRVRVYQSGDVGSESRTTYAAVMTEAGQVHIYDIMPHLSSFDSPGTIISPQQNKPIHTIRAHRYEGYALDWSPPSASSFTKSTRLLTGDNDGLIYLTTCNDSGSWTTEDSRPFRGHSSSVEDVQWSPQESSVFASASSDGTVRIWDIRSKSHKPAISVSVSETDVNVLSWSRLTTHLLATGADDGVWAVWDLRQWKGGNGKKTPIASFDYHKDQITSVEWHPTDDSMVAVAAGDNKVTLWDLSVELDDEESKDTAGVDNFPSQLLFEHYLEQAKEVHWHPQIPGTLVATGAEFSLFRPIPGVYGVQGK